MTFCEIIKDEKTSKKVFQVEIWFITGYKLLKQIKSLHLSKNQINISSERRPLKKVQFCFSSRKAKILTAGIHLVFRGLKSEPDTEIKQKGTFFKGLEGESYDRN